MKNNGEKHWERRDSSPQPVLLPKVTTIKSAPRCMLLRQLRLNLTRKKASKYANGAHTQKQSSL